MMSSESSHGHEYEYGFIRAQIRVIRIRIRNRIRICIRPKTRILTRITEKGAFGKQKQDLHMKPPFCSKASGWKIRSSLTTLTGIKYYLNT